MNQETVFESLSPNLIVADVNQSVDFYVRQLQFKKIASVPETGILNWAMVMRGPVTMMFQTAASIKEDLPSLDFSTAEASATFYIKVKGLDTLLKSLDGKIELVVPLRKTFYGAREFAIKDPDGYILMFAEDVK
ncbi:MAG: VOC family protein [Cyclobacteriaceae bacterium]|nr:VOC family protein [Cyclobacteriaceae bacterium]